MQLGCRVNSNLTLILTVTRLLFSRLVSSKAQIVVDGKLGLVGKGS